MYDASSEYTLSVYARIVVATAVLAVVRLLESIITQRRPYRRTATLLIIIIVVVLVTRAPVLSFPLPLPHEVPEWLRWPVMM